MTKAKWALKSSSLAAVLALAVTTIIGAVAPAQAATATNGATITAPVGLRTGLAYQIVGFNNSDAYDGYEWSDSGGYCDDEDWCFSEGAMLMQGVLTGPAASTMYVDTVELNSVDLDDEDVNIEDDWYIQNTLLPENLCWGQGYNYDVETYTWAVEMCDWADGGYGWVEFPSAGKYHYTVTFKGNFVGSITKTIDIVVADDPTKATFVPTETTWPQYYGGNFDYVQPVDLTLFDAKNRQTTFDWYSGSWYWMWSDEDSDGYDLYDGNDDTDYQWNGTDYTYFVNDDGEVETSTFVSPKLADWNDSSKTSFKTEVDAEVWIEDNDDYLDTVTASWTTKDWVGTDLVDDENDYDSDNFTFGAQAGVAVFNQSGDNYPAESLIEDDLYRNDAIIRTDVDSFDVSYDGGASNADLYLYWDWYKSFDDSKATLTTNFGKTQGDMDYPFVLTDANGKSNLAVDVTKTSEGDYFDAYTASPYGDDYQQAVFADAGFWPGYSVTNMSDAATWFAQDGLGRNDDTSYTKSAVVGSTLTISFKAVDVWGTPVANLPTGIDEDFDDNFEYDAYDDYNLTNANGEVSFTIKNTNDATDIKSDHEIWASFYPYADDRDSWASTADFQFVGSTAVDALYTEAENSGSDWDWYDAADWAAYNDDKGTDVVYLDTAGYDDDWTADETWFNAEVLNADEVSLWGTPITITASEGAFVKGYYDYYPINDYKDDNGYWGDVSGYDVSDFSASSVTKPSNEASWEDGDSGTFVGVSSVTGDVTYTISAAGKSDVYKQTYANSVWDARYVSAIDTTVDSAVAGDVATATFKVTDRFGNAVKDIAVEFTENGAAVFASSSNAYTDVTDADGLVSIDVLTPAYGNASQDVTATVVDGADYDAVDTQVFDKAEKVTDSYYTDGTYTVADLTAGESTDNAIIAWSVAAPVVKIGAVKGGVRIIIQGAAGQIAKVWFNGKAKGLIAVGSDAIIKRYKVKKGKTVTVKVAVSNASGLKIAKRKVTVKK